MLQCLLADSTAYSNAHFGQGSTIIIAMDNVGCSGSEATLFSCTHSTSHNCGHHEDAGVQCVPRECILLFVYLFIYLFIIYLFIYFFVCLFVCLFIYLFVYLSRCACHARMHVYVCVCVINHETYCLTIIGCSHGTTRLIGGTSSMEGRVEVCVNGLWGTVCSHGWTARDANVACRQLGYSGSGM